jgi:hypothetical protein
MNNLTDEDLEARLRAVLQADAARAPVGSPASPAGMSQRRRRLAPGLPAQRRARLAVAAGLVVVMAAGLSAGLSLAGGSRAPLSAPANAAELLVRAAAVSAAQPAPRDDQYIYTEATGISPASLQPGSNRTVRYTTWTWSSVDGKTGDLIHQKPCQRVPGGPDGLGPLTCGERMYSGGTAFHFPKGFSGKLGGEFPFKLPKGAKRIPTLPQTYAAARGLPTSARQLETYLKDLPGDGGPAPIWPQLARLVEFVPILPPKVAAAVFTLASQQPRITLRHVTDAAGRPGIGISQGGDTSHVQLIFNPATYQLEGIDVTNSDLIITPTGPVAGARSMAIVRTAIVNSEPSG